MRVLFLHPNFPAQFKNLCKYFITKDADVIFVCQTHYGRKIKGVNLLTIKYKGGHEEFIRKGKTELAKINMRADDYRNAFNKLKESEWNPDLVISHTGWGCGISLKEVWPNTKIITYMEWWFDPHSALIEELKSNKYLNYSEKTIKKLWRRNVPMTFEMALSDVIVAPTMWQRSQLPKHLRSRCQVIHDGIDRSIFNYKSENRSLIPKITYGTRGMEPMRCFPEFIQCLPKLLRKWPDLTVEIAGIDEICYGGNTPSEGSWGKWAKNFLAANKVDSKVKWLGRLKTEEYVKWLQSSWCHVYLTQPYVAGWSLTECLFTMTPVVANKNGATMEFCENIPYAIYTKDLTVDSLCSGISKHLRNRERWDTNKTNEELENIFQEWDSKTTEKRWANVTNAVLDH